MCQLQMKSNISNNCRSGVAEEYDEFWQIMTDFTDYLKDLPSETHKKDIETGNQAKQLCDVAMLSLKRSNIFVILNIVIL